MKYAFDNNLYLKIQREAISKRIASFGDKLYLEFGGKLFDDYHAARVLPGFRPDSKLIMLEGLKDKAEIVIAVNADDVISNKLRSDIGITYSTEVERLIDAFRQVGLYVSSVVLSFYKDSPVIESFIKKLEKNQINVYKHYKISGYPQNIALACSDEGFGKNEYVKTTRPLIVVTAPGPGSGKMATCLSQLYHENKNGVRAGYAKYETFPVWNLPLKHPVNLAYEAATVDLNDVNMIDPFHLDAYNKIAVNYNRDVEVFPLLREIFNRIYGSSPYNSPTDMGVNMVGFAINDDDGCKKASNYEIIRRYYQARKYRFLGKFSDEAVNKAELLIQSAGIQLENRKCVTACMKKVEEGNTEVCAMELNNHKLITGKKSSLLSAPAALILNALKKLAKIDDSIDIISPNILEPVRKLKTEGLKHHNPYLHIEEVLLILSIQSLTSPMTEHALNQLPKLKGCQVHSSILLSDVDLNCFKKLGIDVTEEPLNPGKKLYNR